MSDYDITVYPIYTMYERKNKNTMWHPFAMFLDENNVIQTCIARWIFLKAKTEKNTTEIGYTSGNWAGKYPTVSLPKNTEMTRVWK